MTKNTGIEDKKKKNRQSSASKISSGFVATDVAEISTKQAAETFAKPESYTGNRTLYDSGQAKYRAKAKLFGNGETVVDPYTGDVLVLTKKEAKMLYGDDWQRHLAESDHIKPLENIFEDTKNSVWNTNDDIKNAANSEANLKVTSRKYNNAKRKRTNREFVEDEEYQAKTGVKVTKKGKDQAIADEENAERMVTNQLKQSATKNMLKTGHEAGKTGAKNAGITALTVSGIMNFVSVIKGDKTSEEAISDTVKDGGKAAVTGYAMSNGLTVVSHSLSNSTSKFVQSLAKSNVPGKVITAVIVTGDTLKKWGNGEITTQQCMIELGDKGLNMATMGYSMLVGQAMIPIPIVGGAIGALVGSLLTSSYYNDLIYVLKGREMEHQERMRIIEECNAAAEQTKRYREELEAYLSSYLTDCREYFDSCLSSMNFAYEIGDTEGVIAAANDVTRKLGGNVQFETVSEFKSFLFDDSVDEF